RGHEFRESASLPEKELLQRMEVRRLTAQDEPLWDAFCLANDRAWFWQSTPFLHYQTAYRPQLQTSPRHFYFLREEDIVAICPLAVEEQTFLGKSVKTFSLGGDSLPAPVVKDNLGAADRERLERAIFSEIDRLAREEGIAKASFR